MIDIEVRYKGEKIPIHSAADLRRVRAVLDAVISALEWEFPTVRTCVECGDTIPNCRANRKYCSVSCKNRAMWQRTQARWKEAV